MSEESFDAKEGTMINSEGPELNLNGISVKLQGVAFGCDPVLGASQRRLAGFRGEGFVDFVFSGSYAINPLSGKKIPVYISDYVLAGYGTGAIMAVSRPSILKRISAPSERPIQLRCVSLMDSDQSMRFRPSRSLSA